MRKSTYSQKLKETYELISKFTYEILEVNDKEIRQVNEDGISSIFLKKLSRLRHHGFFVRTKSLGVNESETGVDFDLWIGENDEKYLRFTVQAKSFGNQTSCDQKYKFDKEQCEKLIKHSEKAEHESYPLYFLYQHIIDENLKNKHFSFLDDFINEFSSITFTSAYNIQKLIANDEISFSDIHENKINSKWKNQIYDIFENKEQIGLPLYLLHDLSPSRIEKFQKLISLKNNSLGFFFFFSFGDDPLRVHQITSKQIEEKYGSNAKSSPVEFKNLVILNDINKSFRDQMSAVEDEIK